MTDQQIKEDKELLDKYINEDLDFNNPEFKEALISILQTITLYLSISAEVPEESNEHSCHKFALELATTSLPEPCYACIRNQARHDCIMAMMKMLDVEKIREIIQDEVYFKDGDLLGDYEAAEAIRNAIVGEIENGSL